MPPAYTTGSMDGEWDSDDDDGAEYSGRRFIVPVDEGSGMYMACIDTYI